MNKTEILRALVQKFDYVDDQSQYRLRDLWSFMSWPKLAGDCEDFVLTLLYLLADRSRSKALWQLFTRKARIVYYRHRTTGEGHVALHYDGEYADNITCRWGDGQIPGFRRVVTLPFVFILGKLLLAKLLRPGWT